MDHAASGSQTTSAPASSSAMTSSTSSLDTPSHSPQVLYMTPHHRVTKARYVTSSDPRGYVPVYEYPLNGQWIMMDTDDGYVLWTGIWKALGNSKADIVKILESQPDLANKLRRVRGGYLKMQGTWMARDVALELARRVAWNIRYDLVPLFGPSFPDSCLSPDQPGYGKVVARPPTKQRRSKRSIHGQSPPPTGTTLPFSQESPISPVTDSGLRANDLFESPVESNLSIVPERAFDFVEPEGYAIRAAPERKDSGQSAGNQMQYANQGSWSSLGLSGATIKEESAPGLYDYPSGMGDTQSSGIGQYAEPYAYSSSQHVAGASTSPTHGVGPIRRGSVPHLTYPTSPNANPYAYQEVTVKHERNVTGDSGYASFGSVDNYTGQGEQSSQYQQYAQPGSYQSQEFHSTHERSRSDSRYTPYQSSASMGYTSPTQSHQQAYASAPPSARGSGFPAQSSPASLGYNTHHIDQYHAQSPTHTHGQQPNLHAHSQHQHMSPQHVSSQLHVQQNAAPQGAHYVPSGMGVPTYEYAGYAYGQQQQSNHHAPESEMRMSLEGQMGEDQAGHYRQYGGQY